MTRILFGTTLKRRDDVINSKSREKIYCSLTTTCPIWVYHTFGLGVT